jgi:hypothetical protein
MDEEDTNVSYGLVVSFEDQSASYVHGWEAGGIWQRMRSGAEAEIEATVHTANRETLSRMAVAEGWSIEFKPTEFDEWTQLAMSKTAKAPERPNPHGLRVVA